MELLREPEKLTKESPTKEIFQRVHQQPTHLCPVCMCVFVCVYLSVCICICISTGPSAVYPPPSLEDSYLPESAFSPDEEGSSSYGEPEYNFEYELTEPLLKEVWQK